MLVVLLCYLEIQCYTSGATWRLLVGVRQFLSKADQAVQDTKQSVTTGVAVAVVALVVAAVALVVAVVRR
jgi:hypothetical protein